jgi:hypothetical protein
MSEDMFKLPAFKIDEKRGSLTSVRGFPLSNDFTAEPDQPCRIAGSGFVKGIIPRRNGEGTWTVTYELEVVEVTLEPL